MNQFYFELALRNIIALFFLSLLQPTTFSQNITYSFDENLEIAGSFKPERSLTPLKASNEYGDWSNDFSVPGIVGTVYSTASDGHNLFIGGNFNAAGSILANSIVRWDGKKWHSIGEGEENGIPADAPSGMPTVLAITYADGKLFVGGQFSRAGSVDVNGIAYWDGEKWNKLGDEHSNGVRSKIALDKDTIIHTGAVFSLFAHNNKLYVGGYFQLAGDSSANGVAVWDIKKEKWETLKGGFKSTEESSSVYGYSFAAYGKYVYIGGKFNIAGGIPAENIARWDGNTWTPIGEVKTNIIDLKIDRKGNVFAVGYYQDNDTSGHCGLGMWDGTRWHSIKGPKGFRSTVSRINIVNDELFVIGNFENENGLKCSLARWDGKDWHLISGLGYSHASLFTPVIRGIEFVNGKYYIAGGFTKADSLYVVNVAEWNSTNESWGKLDDGTGNQGIYDGAILTVEKSGTDIYAGGSFSVAGGRYVRSIAKWNGHDWQALGDGEQNGIKGSVFTILSNEKNVFAGGYFGRAGSSEAYHVAQWDGEQWLPLGIGVGGVHGAHVRDLALFGNFLYVAGYFSAVGDENNYEIPANSIARFNLTTRKWEALGKGVQYDEGLPGRIYDMEIQDNRLVIGGEFNTADGMPFKNFTVLEGTVFSGLGTNSETGIDGLVYAVEIVNDEIYIGGHLQSTLQQNQYGILKWDGKFWSEINGDLATDSGEVFITDIEPFRKGFIAGGYFKYAGDKEVNNVAYFDGNEWFGIGGGLQPGVSDMVIMDNKLFITGPSVMSSWESQSIGLAEYVFEDEVTISDDPHIPVTFAVQNYPNPFSNNTTISYSVTYPAHVKLTIFDPSGREIKNLVNEYKEAGQYNSRLYSDDFTDGIYLCRISYGSFSETTKLIIVKR